MGRREVDAGAPGEGGGGGDLVLSMSGYVCRKLVKEMGPFLVSRERNE